MAKRPKSRSLVPIHGGNDNVMTPRYLADAIIAHYQPTGRILEPCRGLGPTYAFWREGWDYCEIKEGIDFLQEPCPEQRYDWVVTNCPWSQFRAFLQRAMKVSDNVVFLSLVNAFWMKARLRDVEEAGFGIKEILLVKQPPLPWPQTGFALGAVYLQREWKGDIKMSRLLEETAVTVSPPLTVLPQVG